MARPRSTERRTAILAAATRVVATDGLSATTASIAKEAGVSNGSLFLYFDTKTTLFNELYVELKTEMGAAATAGLDGTADVREQFEHLWVQWLGWATATPAKPRAIAQLQVSDEITAASHRTVRESLSGIARLLEIARDGGPLQDISSAFVLTLVSAIADATIDSVIREPAAADEHGRVAFDAIWRVLRGSPVAAPA